MFLSESEVAITLCFQLCSAHYTVLQMKNSIRSTSAINMENTHASCYHESTPWAVCKKKWDTKEEKGKSMMCALYVLWYAKGMSRDKVTLNSDKIKPVILAVIELH